MTESGRACAVHGLMECPGYKMIEGSAREKLYKRHQELRKKSGLPDPEYYQELKASYNLPDEERLARIKEIKKKYNVNEGGPFSYGAKKPRKGSVADLAAKKRQEQEKDKQPVEPRDHMVGVARVVKELDVRGVSAGDKAAYDQYAQVRAKGDIIDREASETPSPVSFAGSTQSGFNQDTRPHTKVHQSQLSKDLIAAQTTGLAAQNPEMEKRYTMNKLAVKPTKTNAEIAAQLESQGVAEGKIKLSTDPNWYGAEVDDYKASGPIVNIPANRLVGFEPDDKMNQPASKANVQKIVAGLKQGAKLPPLMVRQYKNGYQVLDGHHRFWAYKLLDVKSIPAQVVPAEDIEEISMTEADPVNRTDVVGSQKPESGFDKVKNFGKAMIPAAKTAALALALPEGNTKQTIKTRGISQGVAEGRKPDYNFDIEDIKKLEQVRDLETLKTLALQLISKPSAKPMKPEKVEWFKSALERMDSPLKVIKLMYDLLLSGEGHSVIGSRKSMNPNTYRQRFGEDQVTNEDVEKYLEEIQRAGYEVLHEQSHSCPECGGPAFSDQLLAEKKDACYSKVKSRYKVWPSAYASGALVRCRKVGAKNWGNKSKK